MALIGNYSVLNKTAGGFITGPSVADTRANYGKTNKMRNSFTALPKNYSRPMGYEPPGSFLIAQTGGGLSSFVQIRGSSVTSAAILNVKTASASLTGSGEVTTAQLSQLVQMAAALNGQGLVTDAQLAAVSSLAAALSGSGTISAGLSASIPLAAALSGLGAIDANLKGIGRLGADISPFTELSPEGLAQSLLDNSDVESGVSMRETLKLILAAVAGKLSGAETATVIIRDVNDSKNRIVATVDSNGNRTAVTYDTGD